MRLVSGFRGRLTAGSLLLACVATLAWVQSARATRDEYEVKAAFLINFARLVEWPDSARPAEQEPLVISVLGGDATLVPIHRGIGETRVGSHSVSVRRISGPTEVPGSHIVFVGREDGGNLEALFLAATEHSVLAVGEAEGFAKRGGAINFFTEESKLRFEINLEAARRAGLEISARLLRLAVLVEDEV